MQGIYRIHDPGGELTETFVAAPGPVGWRYFGRARRAETNDLAYTVDHVVDADWGLVRFRLIDAATGDEAVLVPSGGGVELTLFLGGGLGFPTLKEASAVWCVSPCSVLVAERLLSSLGHDRLQALPIPRELHLLRDPDRLQQLEERPPVHVRIASRSRPEAHDAVELVEFEVAETPLSVRFRDGTPVSAEGWFELIG